MAFSVKSLIGYVQANYPSLPVNATWFNTEFGKIKKAIVSIEALLNAGGMGVTAKAGLPLVADLPAGASGVFKDTSGGGVYLAYNDAGTIKKVALT